MFVFAFAFSLILNECKSNDVSIMMVVLVDHTYKFRFIGPFGQLLTRSTISHRIIHSCTFWKNDGLNVGDGREEEEKKADLKRFFFLFLIQSDKFRSLQAGRQAATMFWSFRISIGTWCNRLLAFFDCQLSDQTKKEEISK